jgi:GNAT superfamily N-acetyltransferase
MQANLVAYFGQFAGLPGVTFVDTDVTWFVNARGEPDNHVLRTNITGDSIDRRIDEIIGQFGQHTDQIDWLVFPGCRPADLGKRLEARGMQSGPGGIWMLADLTSLPGAPAGPANFHVEPVRDTTALEIWRHISAQGFGGDTQIYYDAYARHGFAADAFSLHYIGYVGDQPATSSTLLLAGGIASVYDVSTPPALRRQGYGGAITFAMLAEARARGYQHAWIWSSQMGQSVYRKLGFVAADFGVREYRWRKR